MENLITTLIQKYENCQLNVQLLIGQDYFPFFVEDMFIEQQIKEEEKRSCIDTRLRAGRTWVRMSVERNFCSSNLPVRPWQSPIIHFYWRGSLPAVEGRNLVLTTLLSSARLRMIGAILIFSLFGFMTCSGQLHFLLCVFLDFAVDVYIMWLYLLVINTLYLCVLITA